jgi:hypothetical protein
MERTPAIVDVEVLHCVEPHAKARRVGASNGERLKNRLDGRNLSKGEREEERNDTESRGITQTARSIEMEPIDACLLGGRGSITKRRGLELTRNRSTARETESSVVGRSNKRQNLAGENIVREQNRDNLSKAIAETGEEDGSAVDIRRDNGAGDDHDLIPMDEQPLKGS